MKYAGPNKLEIEMNMKENIERCGQLTTEIRTIQIAINELTS